VVINFGDIAQVNGISDDRVGILSSDVIHMISNFKFI
jgi:hypothetical protein